MAKYFELPFSPKARRELRRAAGNAMNEFRVYETTSERSMIVKANDASDAKRKGNQAWHSKFGVRADWLKLRAKRIEGAQGSRLQ